VVLTNARGVHVTGRKAEQIVYRKHSMFPGGLKETPYKVMQEKKPDEVSTFAPRSSHPCSSHSTRISHTRLLLAVLSAYMHCSIILSLNSFILPLS
jgi:ribosomal protein L13